VCSVSIKLLISVFSMMCLRSSVGILVYIFVISNEASQQFWCVSIDLKSVRSCGMFFMLNALGSVTYRFSVSVRSFAVW
jgi:hypothetical protein